MTSASRGRSDRGRPSRSLTRAKRAGHSYAIETLQSGEFQRWLHDSLVEASRLPPGQVISIDSIADAREVAERTIDDFRKETKRTMGPLEMFDLIGIDPTPPVDWRVATAFYKGLDDALNDPKTVEMLADDIWRMKQDFGSRRHPGMREASRGGWNVIATDGGQSEVVSGPYRSRSEAQREARRTRMPGYRIDVAPSGGRLGEAARVSKKPPSEMPGPAINRELESLDKQRSRINDRLIEAGRGHESAGETARKNDPLSLEWRRIADRQYDLRAEVERRAGPGNYRLPNGGRGFPPLGRRR